MRKRRSAQPVGSAALLALSLAVCLGSAAAAPAAISPTAARGEQAALSVEDREALASLLSYLTDEARQLHQPTQRHDLSGQPAFAPRPSVSSALHLTAAVAAPGPVRTLMHPALAARPELLNLPPPLA